MQAPALRKVAERSATSAEQLTADLRIVEAALGAAALEDACARRNTLLSAREAAAMAAATFSAEPFPGVGSDAWRRLWDAATAFAEHQGEKMPPTHEHASCPLCMQDLAPAARARLARFDEFVEAEISIQVADAEKAIVVAREALPDLVAMRARNSDVLRALAEGTDGAGDCVERWLQGAESGLAQLRSGDLDGLDPVESAPVTTVETWRAARTAEAVGHAALEDASERRRIQASLGELVAREELQCR